MRSPLPVCAPGEAPVGSGPSVAEGAGGSRLAPKAPVVACRCIGTPPRGMPARRNEASGGPGWGTGDRSERPGFYVTLPVTALVAVIAFAPTA